MACVNIGGEQHTLLISIGHKHGHINNAATLLCDAAEELPVQRRPCTLDNHSVALESNHD